MANQKKKEKEKDYNNKIIYKTNKDTDSNNHNPIER